MVIKAFRHVGLFVLVFIIIVVGVLIVEVPVVDESIVFRGDFLEIDGETTIRDDLFQVEVFVIVPQVFYSSVVVEQQVQMVRRSIRHVMRKDTSFRN